MVIGDPGQLRRDERVDLRCAGERTNLVGVGAQGCQVVDACAAGLGVMLLLGDVALQIDGETRRGRIAGASSSARADAASMSGTIEREMW